MEVQGGYERFVTGELFFTQAQGTEVFNCNDLYMMQQRLLGSAVGVLQSSLALSPNTLQLKPLQISTLVLSSAICAKMLNSLNQPNFIRNHVSQEASTTNKLWLCLFDTEVK